MRLYDTRTQRPVKMFPPRTLLVCDLDGVLFDTESLHKESYEEVITKATHQPCQLAFEDLVGRQESDIWSDLITRFGLGLSVAELRRSRSTVLSRLLEGVEVTEQSVVDLVADFGGVRVLLTSQSPDIADMLLRRAGIGVLFGERRFMQSLSTRHSKLGVVGILADEQNVSLSDVVWVEDYSHEVDAATRLGVCTIVVARPYNVHIQRQARLILELTSSH